ncbi:MAG TPA: shikimate kinase [Saprospiraceae bacterium]|nr:shikimate kinase [Saprospiraceae bacterium]HNT19293.1 shikimate kinase [Saprospiraceae bacterium]
MASVIFLTGFMGSGKTAAGRLLASRLGYDFLDLDDWIEKKEGRTISQIFASDGEGVFRDLEQKALHETGNRERMVISCGGGTPCHHNNMEWMNQHGFTVFLNPSSQVLAQRLLSGKAHRPLIRDLDREGLVAFIDDRLKERMPYYTRARLQLVGIHDQETVVSAILEALKPEISFPEGKA